MTEAIRFSPVCISREYLHVGGDVQAAYDRTANWHDVVHLVNNTSLTSQSSSAFVNDADGLKVSPGWCGVSLHRVALGREGSDASWMLGFPLLVILSAVLRVLLAPIDPIGVSPITIVLIPLLISVWMLPMPFIADGIGAWTACRRQAIRRSGAFHKVFERFCLGTLAAAFQALCCALDSIGSLGSQCRLAVEKRGNGCIPSRWSWRREPDRKPSA